jgi:hypothetical protein
MEEEELAQETFLNMSDSEMEARINDGISSTDDDSSDEESQQLQLRAARRHQGDFLDQPQPEDAAAAGSSRGQPQQARAPGGGLSNLLLQGERASPPMGGARGSVTTGK